MSLFKRPTWAQAKPSESPEPDQDLFRHSQRNFASIAADSARRQKARDEKARLKKEKKERRSSIKHDVEKKTEGDEKTEVKRRRIDAKDTAELLGSIGIANVTSLDDSDSEEVERQASEPVRRSPRQTRSAKDAVGLSPVKGMKPMAPEVDVLSDDEVEITATKVRPVEEHEEEEDSDPEFAELKRSAREKKKRQEEDARIHALMHDAKSPTDPDAEVQQQMPPLKILITSPIENTQPLLVYRRLDQRLQEVRQAWVSKQNDSPTVKSTRIFLTHRGQQVWDVTLCKSLGIEWGPDGEYILEGDRTKTGVDRVHLVAVNEHHYAQMKADRARQANQFAEQDEDSADAGATEEIEEAYVRLTIKAKGADGFRLKVKSDTTFVRIIKAAMKNFKIDASNEVWLEFDGERLAPDADVKSTEIEDMDSLDLVVAK